jgi:hypothetical protein
MHWEALLHPVYSPDLAPSDFHVFGPLKEALEGKKFRADDEVTLSVQRWLERGIMRLPEWWRRYVQVQGKYAEK